MEKVLDAEIYTAARPPPGKKEELLHCFRHFELDWTEESILHMVERSLRTRRG